MNYITMGIHDIILQIESLTLMIPNLQVDIYLHFMEG